MVTDSYANGFDAGRWPQWLYSLASLLFDRTVRGVGIIGNRKKHSIGPRTWVGCSVLDNDRVDKRRFLASALRGSPVAQLAGRLFSGLNLSQESFAQ
jgi:hypothetical protein